MTQRTEPSGSDAKADMPANKARGDQNAQATTAKPGPQPSGDSPKPHGDPLKPVLEE